MHEYENVYFNFAGHVDITPSPLVVFVGRQVWAQVSLCREPSILIWHRAVSWYVTVSILGISSRGLPRQRGLSEWASTLQFDRTNF